MTNSQKDINLLIGLSTWNLQCHIPNTWLDDSPNNNNNKSLSFNRQDSFYLSTKTRQTIRRELLCKMLP